MSFNRPLLFVLPPSCSVRPSSDDRWFGRQRWAVGEDADALGMVCETLWNLRQLRKRLLVCIEALIKHSDNKSVNGMQAVMTTISSLVSVLLRCYLLLFERSNRCI